MLWFYCGWVLVPHVGLIFWTRNRSTWGVVLDCLTVENWSVLSLSLLFTYLLPVGSHVALLTLMHHFYRSCPIPHTPLVLSFLFIQSVSSPGYSILYYSWQVQRQGPLLHPISDCCTHSRWARCDIPLLGCFQKKKKKKFQDGGTDTLCKL